MKRKLKPVPPKVYAKVIPTCAHCKGMRVGMKRYKNSLTNEMEYLHKVCYKGLLARVSK